MDINIYDYGVFDTGKPCTVYIQKAIDDCFLSGGGEVIIPTGVYSVGGLRLRSGVTLHLLENAVLMGGIDPDEYNDYLHDTIEPISKEERESYAPTAKKGASLWEDSRPHSRWNNAIIRAIHAKNIAIIGEYGSEINGQNCFDAQGEEGYRGPHAINMWFCENVTLRGYTVRDSANWAHAIQNSQNIMVSELMVLGGHDGFDVRTCDNITIENCRFLTGDDCIAGFDNIGVTVRNCYFESSCNMLRFGGTDVLVENCNGVAPATYGHRFGLSVEEKQSRADTTEKCRHNCLSVFSYYCDNRAEIRKTPGNVMIRNCRFKNPDAIMKLVFGTQWCCNRSLSDITFESCVFEGVCKPMRLIAPPEEPLTLRMNRCVITPRVGYEDIPLIQGENVQKTEFIETRLDGFGDAGVAGDATCRFLKKAPQKLS